MPAMPPRPAGARPAPQDDVDPTISAMAASMDDDMSPMGGDSMGEPDPMGAGEPEMGPEGGPSGIIGDIKKFIDQKAAESGMSVDEIMSQLSNSGDDFNDAENWDKMDDFDGLGDETSVLPPTGEEGTPEGDPEAIGAELPSEDGLDDIQPTDIPRM